MNPIQTSKYYTWISALLAFVLWGGWAFYVNEHSGKGYGVISAITQGTCSFVFTLVMTHAVAFQYNRISGSVAKFFLPPILTVAVTGTLLASIHLAVGTPAVLHTISPALVVALLFCSFTIYKLHIVESNLVQTQENHG